MGFISGGHNRVAHYKNNKKNTKNLLWFIIFSAILLKYGYYGFKYYPVIDDWIQYGVYGLYDNVFREVIIRMNLYTIRPIANISDVYLLSPFWNNMKIPFLIITLMHAYSGYFFYKLLEKNKIPMSIEFLIIYTLLPLGSEATYWISASARVVVGSFFMSLSLYLLSLYFQANKRRYIILFFIINMVSMGYYEEIIGLSFLSSLTLIFINRHKVKHKIIKIIPIINAIFISIYYLIFSRVGNIAVRGSIIKTDFINHSFKLIKEIIKVYTKTHIPIYTNGFLRGMEVLLINKSYIFFLLIIINSIAAGLWLLINNLSLKRQDRSIRYDFAKIIIGSILFWISFAPNFLLDLIWICNRNTFTSFLGFALIIEGLIGIIFRGKAGVYLRSFLVILLTFTFLIVNVSELTDYKNASEADRLIAENIIKNIKDNTFFNGDKSLILFNAETSYIEQNSYYNDHIHNITASDWALTGGVRAVSQNSRIKYLLPIPKNTEVVITKDLLDEAIIMGINDDLSVIDLYIDEFKNGYIHLYDKDGILFGLLYKKDYNEPINNLYIFEKQ